MAGIQAQREVGINPNPYALPPPANALTNQYKLYNSGVQQNAEDYGGIMQGYKNLAASAGTNANLSGYKPTMMQTGGTQFTPQTSPYKQSADLTSAIGNLRGLSETGGYTPEGIADIRARGISPIRSIYAGANRDIDRNRALKGGFSPGYNAAKLKMAREMSDQIGNQVTNVNAGIAQNVAQNRLQAAPQLTNVTGGQSDLANQMGQNNAQMMNQGNLANIANTMQTGQFNANAANQAGQFNAQQRLQPQQTQLAALQGQASLYGTTPALSQLFGNQAMQHAQTQNQINQQGNQLNANLAGEGMRRMAG